MEDVVWDMFSFNFLQLSSTPGGVENVVWDAFFPTPGDVEVGVEDVVWDVFFSSQGRVEVAQRMSSGTRFPSTLFNSLQPHFNPTSTPVTPVV